MRPAPGVKQKEASMMNEVKSPKKPLIFYYLVAMLLVMLFNFIAMPWLSQYQIQEVD